MMDCSMWNRLAAASLVIILFLMIDSHMCQETVYIKEGRHARLNCSLNATDDVWAISWLMSKVNDTEPEVITTCYMHNWKKSCVTKSGKIRYQKTAYGRYKQQTFLHNDNNCLSQLMILNVTAKMRMTVIECVVIRTDDSTDSDPHELTVLQSYDLNVYRLPEIEECTAVVDNESVVEVACEFSKAYPHIICDIFPESDNGIVTSDRDSSFTSASEWHRVRHDDGYDIDGHVYYNVSCSGKYYPRKVGTYRFRVDVYVSRNWTSPMTAFTNLVNVGFIPAKFMALGSNEVNMAEHNVAEHNVAEHNMTEHAKINTAFYTLIAAVTVLVISVILVIGWVIISRQRKCFSVKDTYTDSSNDYESIYNGVDTCTVVNSNETDMVYDSGGNVKWTYSQNSDITNFDDNLVLGHYNNQNLVEPTPHTISSSHNEYIIPCTPSPVIGRSSNNKSITATSDDDDDDYPDDSITPISTYVCEEIYLKY